MKEDLSNIKDQLLVMDAQDGDAKALDKLINRWQKRLWQHAFRLTSDQQAAWDITQQSWLGIIKGLRNLHDPAKFKAWAYRITTNKAIDWIKESKGVKHTSMEEIENSLYEQKEDSGIKELLEKLDRPKKVVLILYYFEQLSVSEISLVLDIPKGTVKSRLYSARKKIKKLWQSHYGNSLDG